MTLALLVTEELSALVTSAPTAEGIASALRAARMGPRVEDGDWIGPAPRVTRVAELGAVRGFRTRVTWLYGWPAGGPWDERPALAELRRLLAERVAGKLAEELGGDWRAPEAVVWSATLNGSVEWWKSGNAARTRTANEFPTGAGRFDPVENPTGPDAGRHPSTVGETVDRARRGLRRSGLGGLAVGGLALWLGSKLLED